MTVVQRTVEISPERWDSRVASLEMDLVIPQEVCMVDYQLICTVMAKSLTHLVL